MLGRGEKMVARKIVIKLPLHESFYYFGKDWDNGDGSEVGRIGRISCFVYRMDDGMFPGIGKIGICQAGVNDVEKDVADRIKTGLGHPNT